MTITHIIIQTRTKTTETAAMQPKIWEPWEEAENPQENKKTNNWENQKELSSQQPFFHIFSMCSTHCLTARTAETGELHFKVTSLEPQRVWATAATYPSWKRGFIEGFNQQTWTFHDISPWSVRYSDSPNQQWDGFKRSIHVFFSWPESWESPAGGVKCMNKKDMSVGMGLLKFQEKIKSMETLLRYTVDSAMFHSQALKFPLVLVKRPRDYSRRNHCSRPGGLSKFMFTRFLTCFR